VEPDLDAEPYAVPDAEPDWDAEPEVEPDPVPELDPLPDFYLYNFSAKFFLEIFLVEMYSFFPPDKYVFIFQ
jgi:hypothetical protein